MELNALQHVLRLAVQGELIANVQLVRREAVDVHLAIIYFALELELPTEATPVLGSRHSHAVVL
jgi:hypothetical protein